MDHLSLDRTEPRRLASLFQDRDEAGPTCPWRPQDLGDILRHQLDAPAPPAPSGAPRSEPPPATFGGLLAHPAPPVERLREMKEFAKSSDTRPDCPLPPEVATALYYAAILAALVRAGQRITELDDRSLRAGAEWALRQPWLAAELRPLFEAGLARMSAGAGGG